MKRAINKLCVDKCILYYAVMDGCYFNNVRSYIIYNKYKRLVKTIV